MDTWAALSVIVKGEKEEDEPVLLTHIFLKEDTDDMLDLLIGFILECTLDKIEVIILAS